MRPGLTIIIGVICLLVGALLWLFSDTLFSGETILSYVMLGSMMLFLGGLLLTVGGVIQALIGVIKTLIVKIRGWIIDDETG
jgi:hypothetical protein